MSFQTSFYSTIFGGGSSSAASSIYSMASEWSNIKSGNYGRLLKKYYSQFSNGTSAAPSTSSATSTTKTKGYDVLENVSGHVQTTDATASSASRSASRSASSMTSYEKQSLQNAGNTSSAAKNVTTALNTLMNQKSYTDAVSQTATGGDDSTDTSGSQAINDKVQAAVQNYVKSYNSLVDASKKTMASGVSANTKNLMDLTERSKDELADIGITIDDKGKLAVNADTLKTATNDTVKAVFSNGGSYGTGAATYTSLVNYYANSAASNGTYTSSGSYAASAASSYNTSV